MRTEFSILAGWNSDGGLLFLVNHPQYKLLAFWEPKFESASGKPFYLCCPLNRAVMYRNSLLALVPGFIPWSAAYKVGTHLIEHAPERIGRDEASRQFNPALANTSLSEVLPHVIGLTAFHQKYLGEFFLQDRLRPFIEAA